MNWNPFKRIAALERELNGLGLSHDHLVDRVDRQGRGINTLMADVVELNRNIGVLTNKLNTLILRADEQENRLLSLQNQFLNRPFPQPVTLTRADVEKEAKARLKRAAYSRKYYANKRAEAAKAAKTAAGIAE